MKRIWKGFALALLGCVLLAGTLSLGQQSNTDEGKRKVKTRVMPNYPELARRMSVGGKVKIEVTITPEGKVRGTKVIGGHPLLVNPSVDAVKEWRFYPGPDETTQVVEFDFKNNAGTDN